MATTGVLTPLEKISSNTDIYSVNPRDEALRMFIAFGKQSGSLDYSPLFISSDGTGIECPAQTFEIRGYRCRVEMTRVIYTAKQNGTYILGITVTSYDGRDASYDIDEKGISDTLPADAIERRDGAYMMPIATFTTTGGQIITLTTMFQQVGPSSGDSVYQKRLVAGSGLTLDDSYSETRSKISSDTKIAGARIIKDWN